MSKLELWLARHGESEANLGNWSITPGNSPLSALGKKQAEQMALKVDKQPDLLIISPFLRTKETAEPLLNRWPNTKTETWPIYEFIYLDPARLHSLPMIEKKEQINSYWQKNDPNYQDSENTESFAQFIQRVKVFHDNILKKQGFIFTIGHGHFLKAFQLGLKYGFDINSKWMSLYREKETENPIKNTEIFQLYFN
ncbi:MAG: histidine phosphatase family protein [Proteobacteria bacterium]|nr:histidine phosphatase family protein [Pseudomonadota bacterium]